MIFAFTRFFSDTLSMRNKFKKLLILSIINCVLLVGGNREIYAQTDSLNIAPAIVNITSNPSDVRAYVDGLYKGNTPIKLFIKKDKRHLIKLEKYGFAYYYYWTDPNRDTIKLAIDLKPNFAWLNFNTKKENTVILIDDTLNAFENNFIRVSVGEHNLKFINNYDDRFLETDIVVNPSDTLSFNVSLGADSRKPIYLSAIIPGWGQAYDNSIIEGLGFFVGTVTSTVLTIMAGDNRNKSYDEYKKLYAHYLEADNELDASLWKSKVTSKLEEVNSYARKKNLFLGLAIGIYALNLIDAYLFHQYDDLIEVDFQHGNVKLSPFVNSEPYDWQLGIKFHF